MEGGTWKEEAGGKVLEKAAGVSLKKREGKSWMDGVTLREETALRSEQEGMI